MEKSVCSEVFQLLSIYSFQSKWHGLKTVLPYISHFHSNTSLHDMSHSMWKPVFGICWLDIGQPVNLFSSVGQSRVYTVKSLGFIEPAVTVERLWSDCTDIWASTGWTGYKKQVFSLFSLLKSCECLVWAVTCKKSTWCKPAQMCSLPEPLLFNCAIYRLVEATTNGWKCFFELSKLKYTCMLSTLLCMMQLITYVNTYISKNKFQYSSKGWFEHACWKRGNKKMWWGYLLTIMTWAEKMYSQISRSDLRKSFFISA